MIQAIAASRSLNSPYRATAVAAESPVASPDTVEIAVPASTSHRGGIAAAAMLGLAATLGATAMPAMATTPAITQTVTQKADVNGSLGFNAWLSASLQQKADGSVTADGSIGMTQVDLIEKNGSINGELQPAGGFSAPVHVDVISQSNGTRVLHGDVGNAGIWLNEIPQKDGTTWIVGNYGGRSVSIQESQDKKGNTHFSGPGLAMVTVDSHGKTISTEVLIPLIGLGH